MSATSFYPVLMSANVPETAAFYHRALGFETTFEASWYVSLRLGDFELAIVAYDHPTVPASFRSTPRGVIVNLEVEDVDAVHERITQDIGLSPLVSLRNEDFGQRHFVVEAPDGVLLDVIQPIAPSAEFAAAYATA